MLRTIELFSGVGTFSMALRGSRLYKLAGNGIVLDVAKALLKELFYV